MTYWEAWEVKPGQTLTAKRLSTLRPDDTFSKVMKDPTNIAPGVHKTRSEARFYEGLQLPSHFEENNPKVPEAGELHSTPDDPELSTGNATSPLVRQWESAP